MQQRGCKSWQSKICKGNSSKGKMDPRVCWLFNTVWKLSLSSSTSWSLMVWNIPWEYQNMKSFCYDWDKIASIIHDLNKKRWVVNQGGWVSNKGNLDFEEIHIRHWELCEAVLCCLSVIKKVYRWLLITPTLSIRAIVLLPPIRHWYEVWYYIMVWWHGMVWSSQHWGPTALVVAPIRHWYGVPRIYLSMQQWKGNNATFEMKKCRDRNRKERLYKV